MSLSLGAGPLVSFAADDTDVELGAPVRHVATLPRQNRPGKNGAGSTTGGSPQ